MLFLKYFLIFAIFVPFVLGNFYVKEETREEAFDEGEEVESSLEPAPSISLTRGLYNFHKHKKLKNKNKSLAKTSSKTSVKINRKGSKLTNDDPILPVPERGVIKKYNAQKPFGNYPNNQYLQEVYSPFDGPYSDPTSTSKLLQLQIISRRGDRTPFWLTKGDHYKESNFPEGLSQQTNVGKERMVKLGRVLRHRYIDFFEDLKSHDIKAESTSGRGHIESTQALLAGLAPPVPEVEGQVWSRIGDPLAELWQPIAVSSVEAGRSWKLDSSAPCRAAELVERLNITRVPALRRLFQKSGSFLEHLEALTGEDFGPNGLGWMYIGYVLDTIQTEAGYLGPSFRPPRWLDRPALAILEKFYDLVYRVYGHAPRYLKLRGGLLLRALLDNMIFAGNGHLNPKVYLATVPDNMIAILEHAIGLFLGRPDFGATILLELRQPTSGYSSAGNSVYNYVLPEEPTVHVFYVNTTNNFDIYPVPLHLSPRFYRLCPNYDHCTLTNFAIGLKDFVINGGEEELRGKLCEQVY